MAVLLNQGEHRRLTAVLGRRTEASGHVGIVPLPVLGTGCRLLVTVRKSALRCWSSQIEADNGDRLRSLEGEPDVADGYLSPLRPVLRTVSRLFATVRSPDCAAGRPGKDRSDPHHDADVRRSSGACPGSPIVGEGSVPRPNCGQIVVARDAGAGEAVQPVAGEHERTVAHLEGFERPTPTSEVWFYGNSLLFAGAHSPGNGLRVTIYMAFASRIDKSPGTAISRSNTRPERSSSAAYSDRVR